MTRQLSVSTCLVFCCL